MSNVFSRRTFIVSLAAAGGAVLAPVDWWIARGRRGGIARADGCTIGELYAGFLLLADDDVAPSCVVYPTMQTPNICGVDEGEDNSTMARPSNFSSIQDLADNTSFTLYKLHPLPIQLAFNSAALIRTPDDDDFSAQISYRSSATAGPPAEPLVVISAAAYYPQPQPLWALTPDSDDLFAALELEQVTFLPEDGVFVENALSGFTSHWISNGIRYTMIDRYSANRTAAEALAALLVTA